LQNPRAPTASPFPDVLFATAHFIEGSVKVDACDDQSARETLPSIALRSKSAAAQANGDALSGAKDAKRIGRLSIGSGLAWRSTIRATATWAGRRP
jgi:hypothetical protein